MTATQMKRLRAKLERAASLTAEAHELAVTGYAVPSLRELTARAADDMTAAMRELAMWDQRMEAHAEAIARDLSK
jgi:hypothetical protein